MLLLSHFIHEVHQGNEHHCRGIFRGKIVPQFGLNLLTAMVLSSFFFGVAFADDRPPEVILGRRTAGRGFLLPGGLPP